jgi:hypothetical protein
MNDGIEPAETIMDGIEDAGTTLGGGDVRRDEEVLGQVARDASAQLSGLLRQPREVERRRLLQCLWFRR